MSNSNQQQTLQEQQITSECKHETHENTEKISHLAVGICPHPPTMFRISRKMTNTSLTTKNRSRHEFLLPKIGIGFSIYRVHSLYSLYTYTQSCYYSNHHYYTCNYSGIILKLSPTFDFLCYTSYLVIISHTITQ